MAEGCSATSRERHILHVDMDAFYAAVEQRDRPELRGKPILVGGSPQGRGVVATASYEARPFGCHSAMPMAQAVRLCPPAIVVPPRFERYAEVSRRVFHILEAFTPLVEPLSIDEAFLDVTGSRQLLGPPVQIAQVLKRRIHAETELTASVGVAPNKFVAKLASDLEKPEGLVVVHPDGVQAFLDPLPITRLCRHRGRNCCAWNCSNRLRPMERPRESNLTPNNATITTHFSGGVRFSRRTRDNDPAPGVWSLTKSARNANDKLVRVIDCPLWCSGDALRAALATPFSYDSPEDPNGADVLPAEYLSVLGAGIEAEHGTLVPTTQGRGICWSHSTKLGLLRGKMELIRVFAPISRGFQHYLMRLNWDLRFVAACASQGPGTALISVPSRRA
jgi:hypothetical protein